MILNIFGSCFGDRFTAINAISDSILHQSVYDSQSLKRCMSYMRFHIKVFITYQINKQSARCVPALEIMLKNSRQFISVLDFIVTKVIAIFKMHKIFGQNKKSVFA